MILMLDDNKNVIKTFKNTKEASWEVFGDERQIKLAIKYNKIAYDVYWRET